MSFCLATDETIFREGEVDLLRFLLPLDLAMTFSLEVCDGVDVAVEVMAKSNGNKKRSKSTSPSRKIVSSVAKQKDMFKQIQQKADRVDWILHPKKS
jgi:hypothetical protein